MYKSFSACYLALCMLQGCGSFPDPQPQSPIDLSKVPVPTFGALPEPTGHPERHPLDERDHRTAKRILIT